MKRLRLLAVADVTDSAWQGKDSGPKAFVQRAFRNADRQVCIVPAASVCYVPEHQKDWEKHPKAHRAMEMLSFDVPSPRGPVWVKQVRIGTVFFFLPPQTVMKMLTGAFTELALLTELEKEL